MSILIRFIGSSLISVGNAKETPGEISIEQETREERKQDYNEKGSLGGEIRQGQGRLIVGRRENIETEKGEPIAQCWKKEVLRLSGTMIFMYISPSLSVTQERSFVLRRQLFFFRYGIHSLSSDDALCFVLIIKFLFLSISKNQAVASSQTSARHAMR